MNNRNPFAVLFLGFITCGIYSIVWYVKTKDEMNELGANIPTAWFLIVPFANFWWMWKYSEGVEEITNGANSTVATFFMLLFLSGIGQAITQSAFNSVSNDTDDGIRIVVDGVGA
jgi:hypothetical protein